MKAIILLYELVLSINCAVLVAFWIFIHYNHKDLNQSFKAIEAMGVYNRLALTAELTLLYKLLFILRRVEIQMDPVYETSQ